MDELLASLRKVVEPSKGADDVQMATPIPAAEMPADRVPDRTVIQISSSEEIANLRKRIARNWERDGQPNGFATLLSSRVVANPAPPPVLLEDHSPDRSHPLQAAAEPVLRQAVDDSDESDIAQVAMQAPKVETSAWRADIRSPSPSWPSGRRDGSGPRGQGLMSENSTAAANASFNRFAETLMSRALADRSVDDMTREMLRPMLKQWLDDHLPQLVERIVRDEIERVARRGARR